jgi:hypothetical protein
METDSGFAHAGAENKQPPLVGALLAALPHHVVVITANESGATV